jgi:two-component system, OmpR family, sensor histidine kinase KdpD
MGDIEQRRPNPEQLLQQVDEEERRAARGRLKIFLGYASGVGKSFRMFDEGRRRRSRGADVVVAATQSSEPAMVKELLRDLEVIPPRLLDGIPAIDMEQVLRRHPQVCLIDGLAHRNPPGSKHMQRWQDVEDLLAAGISVVTSINLQYVKERQAQIEAIRGKVVQDSVPEAFIREADEIELVDAPPEYCTPGSASADATTLSQQQHQLSQLREIALVLAADVVDHQLEAYLKREGIEQAFGTQERILVCLTPRSNASLMIRRARRQADLFYGDLYAVYVQQGVLSPDDQRTIEQNLAAALAANAHVEILHGDDPIGSILQFAHNHGITQIFAGHTQQGGGWLSRWKVNPVERLIMESDGIDVRIFPTEAAVP